MQNEEILAQLKQLNQALADTILLAEKDNNILFYKESIKHTALHIFENAQLLNISEISVKPTANIKIIKQQEEEPLIQKTEEVKPIIEEKQTVIEPIIQPIKEAVVEPIIEKVIIPEVLQPVLEIPKIEVPAKETVQPTIEIKAETVIIANQAVINNISELDENDNSLNAKLAKNKIPVLNVADKLTGMPIKELSKAISISKKFELIKELFNNNNDAYKATLENIEKSNSLNDAMAIIENESLNNSKWQENEDLAEEFITLVKRRFL